MSLRAQIAKLQELAERLPSKIDPVAVYRADPAKLMVDAGFAPDPWQATLLRSTDPRVLMLCARQVGKSTAVAMLALGTALTQPGSTTTIVAPVEEQANELLKKVTGAYHTIGAPVGTVREAVTRLELGNGSRVLALPGKESRMRSYTSALTIFDEAARVPDAVVSAARPTLAVSGGRFVALSTAFAKSGWFYEQWKGSESYLRLSVRATECPRISPSFLASERRTLGERWYAMEYENVFGDDVAAVFASEDIAAARSTAVKPLFPKVALTQPSPPSGVVPLFGN